MREYDEVGVINILGEQWSYGYGDAGKTRGRPDDGCCSYARNRIIINPKHTSPLLDVVAHEVAHAFFPTTREKVIEAVGNAINEVHDNLSSFQPSRHGRLG